MSIFYVDLYNGDDANDGTSWANAWKTGMGGPTAVRIAANDEIRFSKTPDPVSIGDVTWPAQGKILTLSAPRTQYIWSGDGAWTVSAGMSASTRTTSTSIFKVGSGCYSLSPQTAFLTGKMAYHSLGSVLDLSAYQELTFWYKINTNQFATLKLCLCSDTSGNDIVDSFYIPPQYGSNLRPITITKDGGGNLGSSIQSIALYAETDPGTTQMYFNWFTATKINDINFTSLISKNGNAQGGDEPYYPIAYVDGTTVQLSGGANMSLSQMKGCAYAEIETVETFIRKCFTSLTQVTSDTSSVCVFSAKAGSEDNLIKYIGGWEAGTENCNGETYFDGTNCVGLGISVPMDYISVSLMSAVRFASGFSISGNYCEINLRNMLDNRLNGAFVNTSFNSKFTFRGLNNNSGAGLNCIKAARDVFELVESYNNFGQGAFLTSCAYNHFKDLRCDNTNILVQMDLSNGNRIKYTSAFVTRTGWGLSLTPNGGENTLYDSKMYMPSGYMFSSGGGGPVSCERVKCINLLNEKTDPINYSRYIYEHRAFAYLQSDIVHDLEPFAWKVQLEGARHKSWAFDIPLATFAFNANKLVTITVWVKLNEALVSAGKIMIFQNHTFLSSELYTDAAQISDWQQLTLSFTPDINGVAELLYRATSLNASSCYSHVGSISITQAD